MDRKMLFNSDEWISTNAAAAAAAAAAVYAASCLCFRVQPLHHPRHAARTGKVSR